MYSGCLVVRVGGSRLGVGLIKCCDFQRSLLARSISDPSVLATRGAYVFIFSLCCVLSVCNVFTTPRAGHQSRPLPLVICYQILLKNSIYQNINKYINVKLYQMFFFVYKPLLKSGKGRLWWPTLGVVKTLHTDNKQHKENMKT